MRLFRLIKILSPCVSLIWIALPHQAFSLDPTREISQYNHRFWLKRDGLPQNSALAIAQTPNGFLWVGTYEGLARFDGIGFTTYTPLNTPALKMKGVVSLCAARDGSLWIGSSGGGLAVMRQGIFSSVPINGKDPLISVHRIYEDKTGRIWAASSAGLLSMRGDSVEKRYSTSDGLPYPFVSSVAEDSAGRILIVAGGKVSVLQNDCFVEFPLPAEFSGKVRTVCGDNDGNLWLGTPESGVFRLRDGGLQHFGTTEGLLSDATSVLFADSEGALWVGTVSGGVSRIFRGKVSSYGVKSGLSGDEVSSLFEDREKNMWVGVATGGINRFVEGMFTTYPTGSDASRNVVFSLYQDRRGILAGTASREVMQLIQGRFVPYERMRQQLAGIPFSFCRDRHGTLWIGTTRGLYRESGGRTEYYPFGVVSAITEDSFGRIWIGFEKGLAYFANGKFNKYAAPFGGKNPDVRYILEDRKGTFWIGTRNAGLFRFSLRGNRRTPPETIPDDLTRFAPEGGLQSAWVSSLCEDSSGVMWVAAYGGGLSMIKDGKIFSFVAGGLPDDGFHCVLSDRKGNLWMSSNNGVFRVKKSDLEAYAAGRAGSYPWTQFGFSAGMASDECNGGFQSSGVRTHDGKLWFPTMMGAVTVDPDSLPINHVPPSVMLERVKMDRREIALPSPLRATRGDGELEFVYTGISLSAPERIQFRVMLEGFDKEWIDVGTRRIRSYTNIPPGEYQFRVQARNGDGVWNLAGASFGLALEPHFYQTFWFYILCGLAVLFAGAGLNALYRRDRDRQLVSAQLESKLAQARLKVLEMQVQPHFLFNTLNGISVLIRNDPERATRMIARLSEFMRMALDRSDAQEITLREELQFVDRYLQIELLRFADRLSVQQDIAEHLLEAMVPTMILQPLVENAIRHGVSKRRGQVTIHIEARREDTTLLLHVRDNGAGLPAGGEENLQEGIGLTNTRARLQQLYGESHSFELRNLAEGGVDVSLTIPYHKEPIISWKESVH